MGGLKGRGEEMWKGQGLDVTLFLMDSTEIKSFEKMELSSLKCDDLVEDKKDISYEDKLLLSSYKNYNLIGYQSLDYLFFVLPQFEDMHSQFKVFLENMITNATNYINKLILMHNLSEIKTIDINSDLYLVYRIEFDTDIDSGDGGKSSEVNSKDLSKKGKQSKQVIKIKEHVNLVLVVLVIFLLLTIYIN